MDNDREILKTIDKEWLLVLKELVDFGVTKEEFKQFLEKKKNERKST